MVLTLRKASLSALVFLSQFAVSVSAAQIQSLYEGGLENYRSAHYKEAADAFAAAIRQEPSKQNLHYLLANCYVHLEQHRQAVQEYEAAYYLDATSNIAEYCRQALLAYKISLPSPAMQNTSATTGGELEKVKTLIRQQAGFEKDKHGQLAARSKELIKSKIDDEIKRIDIQMQADIQKLYEPLIFTPGPRANPMLAYPDLLKEREAQIRQSAQAEKARLAQEASTRSQVYETWKKDREALLDQTADNLQDQLDKPVGPSGIKLQAHGTGLYVRNYAITGTSKLPDSHAATARFGELGRSAPEPAGSQVPVAKEGAQEHVKGTILKEPEQLKSNVIQM
jgi:hypothetical protein